MRPTRRDILGTIAVTTTLAGCIGGDGGGATPTSTPTDTTTPTAGEMAATLQVASHPEHGDILVGPEGLTLYMFAQDAQGEGASACYDDCANAWPPLTVDGDPTTGEGVMASVSTFERETGETQVVAGGWPLYYFASDEEPGDAKGQGVGDVWWVVRPAGTPARSGPTATPAASATVQVASHPEHGDILVGPEGLTLYMFDQDTQGEGASACYDDCADAWPPLTADGDPTTGEGVTAQLTTFERETGETQVAAGGWPLYYFSSDEVPGDAKGQGVGDVWWVLAPDATPVRPMSTATMTATESGGGGY